MEPAERTAQVQVSRIGSFLQRGQNSRLKKKRQKKKKKKNKDRHLNLKLQKSKGTSSKIATKSREPWKSKLHEKLDPRTQ